VIADLAYIKGKFDLPQSLDFNTFNRQSPRTLNEWGLYLFKAVNGEEFLNKHKERLFNKLDRLQPKTALDVEGRSLDILIGLREEDIFNPLKDYVYLASPREIEVNGQVRKQEITIFDVCCALSVPLRDMYLKEHPELNPELNLNQPYASIKR
jgi:hypothetical protein